MKIVLAYKVKEGENEVTKTVEIELDEQTTGLELKEQFNTKTEMVLHKIDENILDNDFDTKMVQSMFKDDEKYTVSVSTPTVPVDKTEETKHVDVYAEERKKARTEFHYSHFLVAGERNTNQGRTHSHRVEMTVGEQTLSGDALKSALLEKLVQELKSATDVNAAWEAMKNTKELETLKEGQDGFTRSGFAQFFGVKTDSYKALLKVYKELQGAQAAKASPQVV